MEETQTPGVAVGLLHEGEEHVAGFGVTSTENPLEVTPDTLFQIGSITKTFTGTAAMRLVERGELDLDAPVRTYLPELKLSDEDVAARVTMRHLLTHTGGWIGDYFDDFGSGDDALARMCESLATLPQLTPLGEVWSYNNAGFYLAGRVIEVITGKPYEARAAGARARAAGPRADLLLPGRRDDPPLRRRAPPQRGRAADRRASVGDRTRAPCGRRDRVDRRRPAALRALPHGRRRRSPARARRSTRCRRTQLEVGSIFEYVGITWSISERTGARLVGHGGGTNGQQSLFFFAPEHEFAFAVSDESPARAARWRLCGARRAALEAIGAREPEREAIDLDADEYLGRYESALIEAELGATTGQLVLAITPKGGFPKKDSPPPPAPPPEPVAFYAPDRLFATGGDARRGRLSARATTGRSSGSASAAV